jgi:hypothetical protein
VNGYDYEAGRKPPPPQVAGGSAPDRRRGGDRRKRPTPILSRYTFCGRRRAARRKGDRATHLYVDRYGIGLFLLILAIIMLGIVDAFFTLYHVQVHNAVEVNPLMRFLLGKDPKIFFNVKYLLTAVCLLLLCLHKNMRIVRVLLAVIFSLYLIITANHLYLFLAAA